MKDFWGHNNNNNNKNKKKLQRSKEGSGGLMTVYC